jgi:type IV pilus assembly protein PilO
MKIGNQDIRMDNLGNWPKSLRVSIILISGAILLFLAYTFILNNQFGALAALKKDEQQLKESLAKKQQISVNLAAYQTQAKTLENIAEQLNRQLPVQSEIPSLLENVSQLAQNNGLLIKLVRPMETSPHQYYVAIPLYMSVTGNYQEIVNFIAALSSMNRIVTISDFSLQKQGDFKRGEPTQLNFDFIAQTYRYAPSLKATKKVGKSKGKDNET